MRSKIATDDVRIDEIRPLVPPAVLMDELAPSAAQTEFVAETRREAEAIMLGRSSRLLVVVGPCSIHDIKAAMEYGERLKSVMPSLEDALHIVMRVYFEKPRTTVGWKGLINDPHLDESFDINFGLRQARTLLRTLTAEGLPTATEFLDTISPQYIADLVTWGAIGARTTESQIHRELASGLSMPVGFKNATSGSLGVAIDALRAARFPHHFLSVTKEGTSAIVKTKGNEACHVILRGSGSGPNYSAECVTAAAAELEKAKLAPQLMVDCSHGNSSKDHNRQPIVAQDICQQIKGGSQLVAGVMIESHLVEGNQSVKPGQPLTYGQSITDACISWEATVEVLRGLAQAVRQRNAA